ncbi:MAG: TlpA family protein disulfide reductase [Candidatus Omnitrophica bacterium]|nr:TlpA family protein disulfide reductase [Candidatus Omnitrophota bacterium]
MKRIGAIALVGAAILGGYWITQGGMSAQSASEKPAPGGSQRSAAPDFRVTALDGKTVQLSALKGKVVLLDFWATWCPPCRAEIPHFKELHTAYGPKGVELIGLSLDQEGEGVVRSFAQEQGIRYTLAMASPDLPQRYGGIRGIPTTFLIDKQGRIAKKYVGYQDKQVFESQIQSLLRE